MTERALARLRAVAHVLDESIRIPFTDRRIGLDPLLGLVPGVGDLVGAVLSMWVVVEAAWQRAPASVLLRMLLNVAAEAFVGLIPLLGDLFDAVWKANVRNVVLFEAWMVAPERTTARSRLLLLGLLVAMAIFLASLAAAAVLTMQWAWSALAGY